MFRSKRREDLIVFRDSDPLSPRILKTIWDAGSLVDTTPHSFAIDDWDQPAQIGRDLLERGVRITEIHVWCHGYSAGPVLGRMPHPNGRKGDWVSRHRITDAQLRALRAAFPHAKIIWWRCCDVAKSYEFPLRVQAGMPGIITVQHATIVSGSRKLPFLKFEIPMPWWHAMGCALEPGQSPWWRRSGKNLAGCFATSNKIPPRFYKPGRSEI